MKPEIVENPVPEAVQELLKIFKEDLSAVTFPDVGLKVLEDLSGAVQKSAKDLAAAQEAAQAAEQALETSLAELLAKSTRAVAYAKVYAEDKAELLEKLSQLSLGKPARAPKKAEKVKADSPADGTEKAERKAKAAKDPQPEATAE